VYSELGVPLGQTGAFRCSRTVFGVYEQRANNARTTTREQRANNARTTRTRTTERARLPWGATLARGVHAGYSQLSVPLGCPSWDPRDPRGGFPWAFNKPFEANIATTRYRKTEEPKEKDTG